MLEKITPEELAGVGVIGMPDTPRLSTEEMQRKFEETAREVIIPKFNALVDELSAEDAAGKVGAVSVNAQELTPEQKATARENIAALTWEADALDDAQKQQARANIGAIGAQEIGEMGGTVSYAAQQTLNESQQAQARENIGAASRADADGKLPLSGGDMTGWIDFGQATRGLRWKTNDGTVFTFRPYAAGNVLQVTRRMADGTEYGTLNIYANGRVEVEGASDSLERVHNIMVVPAGTDVGSLSLSAGTIVMVRK